MNMDMKSTIAGLGLVLAASAAFADNPAMLPLATSKGCNSCHDVATKLVGPAFTDVAKKYKGQADAPAMLAKKIKDGGKGVWGHIPMPPHPDVSDADLKTLVAWVLSL